MNLKKISAIDTGGLDTLVFSAMRFQECGGRLVLFRLGQSAPNSTDLVNVNTVPETYQEEAEAVASFLHEPAAPRYDILEFVEKQNRLTDRNAAR